VARHIIRTASCAVLIGGEDRRGLRNDHTHMKIQHRAPTAAGPSA
jgi:hypothetical protein